MIINLQYVPSINPCSVLGREKFELLVLCNSVTHRCLTRLRPVFRFYFYCFPTWCQPRRWSRILPPSRAEALLPWPPRLRFGGSSGNQLNFVRATHGGYIYPSGRFVRASLLFPCFTLLAFLADLAVDLDLSELAKLLCCMPPSVIFTTTNNAPWLFEFIQVLASECIIPRH